MKELGRANQRMDKLEDLVNAVRAVLMMAQQRGNIAPFEVEMLKQQIEAFDSWDMAEDQEERA